MSFYSRLYHLLRRVGDSITTPRTCNRIVQRTSSVIVGIGHGESCRIRRCNPDDTEDQCHQDEAIYNFECQFTKHNSSIFQMDPSGEKISNSSTPLNVDYFTKVLYPHHSSRLITKMEKFSTASTTKLLSIQSFIFQNLHRQTICHNFSFIHHDRARK